MYLFNRTRQAKPDRMLDAMPSAVEIATKVTQLTGLDIYVWTVRFGEPVGTIMWSARLDSQAQLFEAQDKMAADEGYINLALAMADLYEGPAVDGMLRVVSGSPSDAPSRFIQTTQATMANGMYGQAMAFGVAMQEFIHAERGQPTMFGAATYGGFADVGWIVGADTMAQIDEGDDWQMNNTDYHALVQSAAGLFVEGTGHQRLLEKLN